MKGKINMIIGIAIILFGIAIDQITKIITFKYLSFDENYRVIPGLFRFELVKNRGAMFGILPNELWLFIIVTVIALGFLAYLAKDFNLKENPIFSASFALIVIGAIGNFIDRITIGYVRDFVTFDFFDFAVFNFADMCLTVGVIFLSIDILFGETGARWS